MLDAAPGRLPILGEVLILRKDVLNRISACVGQFLAAMVLQPLKQIQTRPYPVQVSVLQLPMELRVARKAVFLAQPSQPNQKTLKWTLPVDTIRKTSK